MSKQTTSFESFRSSAEGHTVACVEKTLWLDTETPVSLYMKSAGDSAFSFLFESVEGGRSLGRFSLIGFDPVATISVRDGVTRLQVLRDEGAECSKAFRTSKSPLESVRSVVETFRSMPADGRPRFSGGWVGHFAYDAIRYEERIPLPASDLDPALPEIHLALYTEGIVVDNVLRGVTLFTNVLLGNAGGNVQHLRNKYEEALHSLQRLESRIRSRTPSGQSPAPAAPTEHTSITGRSTYEQWVRDAKEYIAAGDIFQVVLSRRETVGSERHPFEVYRSLRRINPSPYMYYLRYAGREIIGSSPEMLVRIERGEIQTRPIAGTRPRGATEAAEREIERDLRSDEKEKAEHLMLVDLSRNDLGRVCEAGSVRVSDFMSVEKFSHVMHMCSTVTGVLRSGVTPLQALFSCFPAGTLSGAPKIRAMEIISELEPVRRGVYGGAIGYVDFSGNLDTCIAIRTIVHADGTYSLQAGAGLVQDSEPGREYEETVNKMAALHEALRA